jgi:hypothetical protein
MTRLEIIRHLIKVALTVLGFAAYEKDAMSDRQLDSLWADIRHKVGGIFITGNQNHTDIMIGEVPEEQRKSIAKSLASLLSNHRFGVKEFSLLPGFKIEVNGIPFRDRDVAACFYMRVMNLEAAKLEIDLGDDIATREHKIAETLRLK